ncbi:hypothetical protein DL544_17280 [Stenotrophomonas sp. pho]|nr:hypothetical protein DL544_17280 [Stenotrophomonas sp. pho]
MALARLDGGVNENTGHCPVFSFAATAAKPATCATPPGHFPATPLRPNTPTRPGRGKGPDRPSHPGPDQLPIGEGVMRNRVTRRYFQQLFALYAGFVQSR